MNARFWLMSLLLTMAIVAFGIIYSAVNDPEVDKLDFLKVGSSEQPKETMIDQAKNTVNNK
jgi:hypothetical protein